MSEQKDSKLKALKLTLDKLDKTYGKGSVMRLGDQEVEKVESISSGSIGIDIALGIGGYPKGRVVEKGPLFKIKPNSLDLLFPPSNSYSLLD